MGEIQSTLHEYVFFPIFDRFTNPFNYVEFASQFLYGVPDALVQPEDYKDLYKLCIDVFKMAFREAVEMKRRFAQLALGMPLMQYDFSAFKNEPVMAHGSTNTLIDELKLEIHSDDFTHITPEEVRGWLTELFSSEDLDPFQIADIVESRFDPPGDRKEADVRKVADKIIDCICKFVKLSTQGGVTLRARYSPLVPASYRELDIVYPDMVVRDYDRVGGLFHVGATGDGDGDGNEVDPARIDSIVAIIEFKPYPLFKDTPLASGLHISDLVEPDFAEIVKQLEVYMIAAKTRFGVLHDSQYLILLEFRSEEIPDRLQFKDERAQLQLESNSVLRIPSKVMILDKDSEGPTMLEALAGFLYQAKHDTLAEEFFRRLPPSLVMKDDRVLNMKTKDDEDNGKGQDKDKNEGQSKNTDSTKSAQITNLPYSHMISLVPDTTTTVVFPGSPIDCGWSESSGTAGSSGTKSSEETKVDSVESSDGKLPLIMLDHFTGATPLKVSRSSFTQVYRIKALYLKQFISDPIEDDDDIVMKIFDPEYPTDLRQLMDYDGERITATYDMEQRSIKMLRNIPDFHSVYLNHKEFMVSYNRGLGTDRITGKVILSKYVRKTKIPRGDLDLYRQAKEQLSLVHEAGIICKDMKADNILVEKHTKEVYIIDFNTVRFVSDERSSPYYLYFNYNIFVKLEDANEAYMADEKKLKSIFH